ncbi:MAG: hypothetical protein BWY01_00588 [Synergistetes bacterium ADurb.Bin155]|jgi:hypothetical protein|nr:hypothetical protein [Synergistales bacterium]NMD17165.1 hypothetical protein [Synergistaceae bacterium]OQB46422.1 MAG: hypothetical protein BWY01_00588 [Synergistetes bacterium ADurb.Bin155]MBP8996161.1 hypothetical protein [Synergistales bacterium]HOC82221.1 hypothetical protein [Synergistales bacterium]
MQMPMQISLDEVLSMLLARVDSLAFNDENLKTKFNILARAMYRKGLISDEDIVDSIREEHRILADLGLIQEVPADDVIRTVAEGILQWVKGDAAAIKKAMEDYEKKLQELAKQQAEKPKIDVASPAVLQQLDMLSGKGKGKSKLIY